MTLPDHLTVSRFILAAVLIACLSVPFFPGALPLALLVFLLAALTDALDGHLARTVYGTSDFGKLMDPLADKVLTAAAFIGFVEFGVMPAWMVVLILSREFMVTGLRLLAVEKQVVIAANVWGKQKTIWQMAYIAAVLLVLAVYSVYPLRFMETDLFWTATVWAGGAVTALTVWSGIVYFRQNLSILHNRN